MQCQHVYKYNSAGSLIEQDDFDYGSGAPGALLKKTAITYASLGNITKFRQAVTVTNSAGAIVSQTNYNYDETAVTAPTNQPTPQHATVSASRGNLTSVNYFTQGSTFLTRHITYFDTGKIQTVTDVNGAQTTYNYGSLSATCGNAFPTSVSEPLGSLSRSMSWNCVGGVETQITDENNQSTTIAYTDPDFWRPASITDPTSAAANFTYTGATQRETSMPFDSGSSALDIVTTRDGLGRLHLAQVREAPGSSNFDTTESDFDTLGRPSKVTFPYIGTLGQTSSTAPGQATTYDALNRVLSLADNSGGTRTFSFTQNDVLITRGPAPTGENTKRRQEEFDGLGRLISVCEITSGTTGAPAGTCAQKTPQTGYWTKYSYDAVGRLTGIAQNAQSSNPQTRTFVYDLLGRLTSESNPESGTSTYVYDTDTTCGTSSGDRVKKTDAAGNVTCTAYDALHRPTSVTYPSGPNSSSTPMKVFYYDTSHFNTTSNTKGRLASAGTCLNPTCAGPWITAEDFSYSPRGELTDLFELTPNSGGWYHTTQTYWANSAPNQLSGIPGLPTFTSAPDGEGRPYKVSASSGQNPVTSTVFNAASLPTSVTYGSGDSDTFTYDSNTNRITQYQFIVNGQSLTGVLTWNANHSLASQNIADPFNSADTQNCTYTHDDLTRLASVNCGSIFSQTFSYDAFGNISKSGTYTFQPIYNSATNQFSSVPGVTVSYDADGNVLSDGSHAYNWDATGKTTTVDSVNLTYDALGRMVEQNRSGSYTQIVYSPSGAKLALMNGQTLQKGLVPLPGGGLAVYNSSGLLYYGHPDHLGSMKFGSTPSRTIYFDVAYAPFGEIYASSGTADPAFTGQRQDTVAGLYDFPDRQYSTQGRWPVPDPSGLASMHLSDPQTLNRYAYVRNNPLVFIDPQGLDECGEGEGDSFSSEGDGCGDGGTGGGGGGGVGDTGDPNPGDPGNSGSDCTSNDANCGDNTGTEGNPDPSQPDPNGNQNTQNQDNSGIQCPADGTTCGPSDGGLVSATTCDTNGCSNVTVDVVVANANDTLPTDAVQVFSQTANIFPDFLTQHYQFSPGVCTSAKLVFTGAGVTRALISVGWLRAGVVLSNPELGLVLAGTGLVIAVGCM